MSRGPRNSDQLDFMSTAAEKPSLKPGQVDPVAMGLVLDLHRVTPPRALAP
ncbi:hypothetical protein [Rhodococcus erythropolis]|uniref:hypothetical protein n=1 Tax=Rhodococcus erythropolis TaxID=1833 RepID=UPI00159F60FC|nr:hypothetical protein [Rhodococcus erythropolis]